MEILAWLVPAGCVTVLAMLWTGWVGRPRPEQVERSDASAERFAKAILKQHPTAGRPGPSRPRDRSTGIAVRPSRNTGSGEPQARRSA